MSEFEALTWVLEPWFDALLKDIPAEVRARILREIRPIPWDELSPEQRRAWAYQWDYKHDPAMEDERNRQWEFFVKHEELQEKILEWEAMETRTAGDLASKEKRLAELRSELHRMDFAFQSVAGEYVPPRPELPDGDEADTPPVRYLPYPKALHLLHERLEASPEELAAWIFYGPQGGGLAAYRNANELRPAPRFHFEIMEGGDYLELMMSCWLVESDVRTFEPAERYILGKALIERWSATPGIRAEAYIRAKIAESRLGDLHPLFGITQGSDPEDGELPPLEEALFSLTEIERIEAGDFGASQSDVSAASESALSVGSPEWRSARARDAANARHDKPGGSREKRKRLIEIWESGKYDTKDRCAEEECRALNMTQAGARNILKGLPKPKRER